MLNFFARAPAQVRILRRFHVSVELAGVFYSPSPGGGRNRTTILNYIVKNNFGLNRIDFNQWSCPYYVRIISQRAYIYVTNITYLVWSFNTHYYTRAKYRLKMKILKFHCATRGLYLKCFANRAYNVHTASYVKRRRLWRYEQSNFNSKLKIFDLRLLTTIFAGSLFWIVITGRTMVLH